MFNIYNKFKKIFHKFFSLTKIHCNLHIIYYAQLRLQNDRPSSRKKFLNKSTKFLLLYLHWIIIDVMGNTKYMHICDIFEWGIIRLSSQGYSRSYRRVYSRAINIIGPRRLSRRDEWSFRASGGTSEWLAARRTANKNRRGGRNAPRSKD